ncbi:MAG: transporter related [Acidimicrobiaceae bacterium]|jgi:ABC-type branched-subunit amino acid transport system ATPase component|nr:transporter related [Acidimicrobiaceae bacterium]
MPALSTESVTAGYGRAPIINDISLSAELGTVTTIIGPNGAGKSTFAKTLVGILRPMSGRISVNDVDITRMPGHQIPRHGLVYVPQNDNVFKRLTVRENLEVGGFASRSNTDARMEEILGIFTDLDKAKEKRAGFLSGGQQNLLAIARALMIDPAVIMLDEPTAGLSPAYTDVVWNQIARISQLNTAVVVVEQNVERALKHSDFVHIFVAGRNHVHGAAKEIASLDLASIFLGRSHAN